MAAAVPPLTEVVKKVDRAVAKLEQLQSSIRAHNRCENAQLVGREQLSAREEARVGRQGLLLPAAKEGKRRQSGLVKAKVSSGFAKNGMPDIVEALSRRESISNKENAESKKKWQKKSSMHGGTGLAELPSPPSVGKPSPTRRVLENRQTNVLGVEKQFPLPMSSVSDSKHAQASDKENRHCKVSDTRHNNGSSGRPPWKSVTVISTNNRYAATIAERVRPSSASIVAHHLSEGTVSATTRAAKREFPKDRKIQDSSSLSASGRPIKLGTASIRPSLARENGTTGPGKREFPKDRKIQDRSSLPASWRPIELDTAPIGPSPARENIDLTKSFCVDVRSAPNRPWSLATKLSNTTRPLVMFPNPAFRPYPQHRVCDGEASAFSQVPRASPKLTPFKSRQLKPLELSSLQQPLFDPLPVTIRPYLSPSKTSPRQLRPREEDPLDFLMDAKAQAAPSSLPPSTIRSTSSRKTTQQSMSLPLQKENLLRGRLSLPCSPSKSFNKRFPLSQRTKITNTSMNSAVTALPSLNTRLPARTDLASIDSIRITPPPRLAKSLSNSILATPLASPLPHPPTWRVLPARASNFSSGASSCLQAEHGMHNTPRVNPPSRTASSRALQGILEPTQKNAPPKCFLRNSNSSLWPSITQKASSYQQYSVDCTSNCAGAGPYLVRHVKRWMPSRTAGLSADKCPSIRK